MSASQAIPPRFRVALTGGIASGKTAVADEFIALGIPVIDADQIARDIVAPGSPALAKIVAAFGPDSVDSSGRMNRPLMRERIFAEPGLRKKLEAITHPAIRDEFASRSLTAPGEYQIHAIPLFAEGGAQGNYDRVLVIDCPEHLQLQRLLQRDRVDEVQARQTLAAQASREQRLSIADDVIVNDGDFESLRNAVHRLHKRYLALAANKTAEKI